MNRSEQQGHPSALARFLLLAVSSLVGLLVAEAGIRVYDGLPVLALRLPSHSIEKKEPSLLELASALVETEDVDPAWIDEVPPPLANRGAPSPIHLAAQVAGVSRGGLESDLYRQWNSVYAERFGCKPGAGLDRLPSPLMVFDAPDPSPHPVYRQPLSTTTPLGLVTGRYGWRGPDVSLDKPPGTIRLAFVGASTTIGAHWFPFSYPEYVVHWLNLWASRSGLPVRFDGINAAREGLNSAGSAAIVRQEVVPMEPDLVVYYEGANQFRLDDLVDIPTQRPVMKNFSLAPERWADFAFPWRPYSALLRLLDTRVQAAAMGDGCEPAKPDYRFTWPTDVDEDAPNPDSRHLPLGLPRIVSDLDLIHEELDGAGAELAVSSFFWLVEDGQCFEGQHLPIYKMLNLRWWPFRYADLRRMADFQNRVLARYAASRGLLFVDVAGLVPPKPRLFADAVHFSRPGVRAQAWAVFQSILPRIRERIAAGAWPRPDRVALDEHPNIRPPKAFEGCEDFLAQRGSGR